MKPDAHRPADIPLLERRRLARLIADVPAEFAVLIGSWARGTQSRPTSDIDVLLGVPSRSRCPHPDRMHVICMSADEIARRVADRDDLALWCLRFGVPISGRSRWEELRRDLLKNGSPWPDPVRKVRLASRQVSYSRDLLRMGDVEAARQELRTAVGHLARAVLIRAGAFPLSRPELSAQLRAKDSHELATLFDQLEEMTLDHDRLEEALVVVERYIAPPERWTA